MRSRFLALFLILPLSAFGSAKDWMAAKRDSAKLSELCIPGTHDSGALYEPLAGTAKCQTLAISEQLAAGVRFLDIRCRHVNDAFEIYHGGVFQRTTFGDVLETVAGFLRAHPSETIVLSVKQEHTPKGVSRSFEATFDAYVAKDPARWWLGTQIPSLGEVRGKIVLLRRFDGRPQGISALGWKDNATFTSGPLRVQDEYEVADNDKKWAAIVALQKDSKNSSANLLSLNFVSGYQPRLFGVPNIPAVSGDMNARLESLLVNAPGDYPGIFVVDFVTPELSARILDMGM